jgi:hypothetical protein
MRRRVIVPVALLLFAIARPAVHAQRTPNPPTRANDARWPQQVISVNPFLPLFGYFQGEYERRISETLTFAIDGSYLRWDRLYTNLDAKLRLYPQQRAPDGLGIAAGLGIGTVRLDGYSGCGEYPTDCRAVRRNETGPTFAVEMQYQWLLGSRRATAMTLGGGVKRYFISDDRTDSFDGLAPTIRVSIGYAF